MQRRQRNGNRYLRKGVNYVKDGKEVKVQGDTIVLALGAKPENQLYYDLDKQKIVVRGDFRGIDIFGKIVYRSQLKRRYS